MKVKKIEKARKDYPAFWIKKWDSYYSWKFRYGGERKSLTYPTPRQLTQNWFTLSIYDIQDQIDWFEIENEEDFESQKEDIVNSIQELLDEQQERLDNMPEHLQESSSSGQLLQERIDWLQDILDELDGCDFDEDDIEWSNENIQNISINL